MSKDDFFDRVVLVTERVLTRRRKKIRIKKEKQKQKNIIVDWLEAFVWAAGMVLLINQYLFQAYRIPSGSMIDTLLIGDHIFVNKIIFGPELLPGVAKLPSPIKPHRNDVIIFENPSYISRGPVFDIVQRVLYMLTLSLVDIDRDASGQPEAHFLIKRAVGMPGDILTLDRGEIRIRFAGEDHVVRERDFNKARGYNHRISRLMEDARYPSLEAAGTISAYQDMWLNPPQSLVSAAEPASRIQQYADYFAYEKSRLTMLRSANPHDNRYRIRLAQLSQGWYVPDGRIMPLGDNRDNSRDGRYFGPVRLTKILGQGQLIYWPLQRIGSIQ
jgi:signal peptidase I